MLGIIRDSFAWSCLQGAHSWDRRQAAWERHLSEYTQVSTKHQECKTPRSYENGTHVHSPSYCALHLISRGCRCFVQEDQRGWITCPRSNPARSDLHQRLPPRPVLWWATGNPWADTSMWLCKLVAKTPPRGVMPWCICAHLEVLVAALKLPLASLLWSITAVSSVPLIIGNAGDFALKQNLPYQHCWCVYKGVFFHWKPLS